MGVFSSGGGSRLRLGTRGSPLALIQAEMVRTALVRVHGDLEVEIVAVRTTGDRVRDRPLAEIGGKALWTKELDEALLAGEVDACVHSMKDVETIRPVDVVVAAVLPRADVRERLIGAPSVSALPIGATVGTASARREAQLRRLRPDLRIVPIRGNIATRLAKLAAGEVDATLLAAAGLARIGREDVGSAIPITEMLPPAGQGAIGVETLADGPARCFVAAINDEQTSCCVAAERALLSALRAGCRSPVGAFAHHHAGELWLRVELLSTDGRDRVADCTILRSGGITPAVVANNLLSRAPASLAKIFTGSNSAAHT